MPNPKLPGNPIVEAACEFRLPEDAGNLTLPGLLYAEVGRRYSVIDHAPFQINVLVGGQGLPQTLFPPVTLFDQERASAIRVVGPRVSIHRLRPYTGWEESFLPDIEEAVGAISRVLPGVAFEAVQLRYLNRLTLAARTVEELGAWVNVGDLMAMRQPGASLVHFALRLAEVRDGTIREVGLMAEGDAFQTGSPPEGPRSFLLDLLYGRGAIAAEGLRQWLTEAHVGIYEAFLRCTSAALRERFTVAHGDGGDESCPPS